jgi:DNA-binding MarR family transcriptional regulator
MARTKAEQLTELVLNVFRANGALSAWGDEFAAVTGLSTARWQMLGAVALAAQPMTAPRLAAQMGMTRQGAQKQLNVLVQEGLVEAQANPTHRRSPHYLLTAHGRTLFDSIDARWNGHAAQASSSFRGQDLESAIAVLKTLADLHSMKDGSHENEA